MSWDRLKSDFIYKIPGVAGLPIDSYLLKNHAFDVPAKRMSKVEYIVIGGALILRMDDDAKEYVRNVTPDGFLPHFFTGFRATWQILDLADCWQNENGKVYDNSICIAPITAVDETSLMIPLMYSWTPLHDTAKLTAYLLKKYDLTIANIKVTNSCTGFMRSHWKDFIKEVKQAYKKI